MKFSLLLLLPLANGFSTSAPSASKLDTSKPFVMPAELISKALATNVGSPFYAYSYPHLKHQIDEAKSWPAPYEGEHKTIECREP